MRHKAKTIIAVFSLIMVIMLSCEEGNETKISKYNSDASHNTGQNCMNCHKSGGEGDGVFEVAGTVYESTRTTTYPNATVKFYTGPNGTGNLKYTIQVDALGNFYTTEGISFGSGLYVSVEGDQQTNYMQSSLTTGACNSCHGGQTGKIWTE